MARQTVTTTTTSRNYVANKSVTTMTKNSPGNTSIGSRGGKGNPSRCPSCGRYMSGSKR